MAPSSAPNLGTLSLLMKMGETQLRSDRFARLTVTIGDVTQGIVGKRREGTWQRIYILPIYEAEINENISKSCLLRSYMNVRSTKLDYVCGFSPHPVSENTVIGGNQTAELIPGNKKKGLAVPRQRHPDHPERGPRRYQETGCAVQSHGAFPWNMTNGSNQESSGRSSDCMAALIVFFYGLLLCQRRRAPSTGCWKGGMMS